MSRCLKTLSIKRPSSSRGVNFQVLISGHFLHLSPASSNILRAGWRIVGGRAPLRLIWENSQHPQMPCVISTRNGWILGEKNSEKCSLCLIMFRSNWTEILWNVLIWAASRLFGANKRNNCQCSRTAKTSGDPRIWRFIGGLAFLSASRPPAQEALDRKCQLAPKTAHGIPRSWDGEKVPDSRHLPFTY